MFPIHRESLCSCKTLPGSAAAIALEVTTWGLQSPGTCTEWGKEDDEND